MHKKVTWLELFYDLIYVVAVSITIHVLAHAHDGHVSADSMMKYVLIFFPLWWAWSGFTVYVNRFGEDNTQQRLIYFIQMLFVILVAVSISTDFVANYLPFVIGYVGIRLCTVYMYVHIWLKGKKSSRIAGFLSKGFLFGALVSLSSILFPGDWKFIVLYAGLAIDSLIPLLSRRILKQHPVQNHHLIERYGLVAIILLGECILNIVTTLREAPVTADLAMAGVLGFILTVALWWHYFESSSFALEENCKGAGHSIIYGHFLLYLSLGVFANVVRFGINQELELHQYQQFSMAAVILFFIATVFIFYMHGKTSKHKIWFARYIAIVIITASGLLLLPTVNIVLIGTTIVVLGHLIYFIFRIRKLKRSLPVTL